jgi:hypothetical protein
MTTHTAHEEAERFNVYGVLRTVSYSARAGLNYLSFIDEAGNFLA